jgi:cell division protein FtsZ
MSINLQMPDIKELKPRITVFGVGGAGGNAVNNMIDAGLDGVEFVVANTDAQALSLSKCERIVQMGIAATEGLGAGSQPELGRAAAEETIDEINDHLTNSHMAFITAGMGGGTGTGAAPVVAKAARAQGVLTVGVVTKPFQFEGQRRMRIADSGIDELQKNVDTLIVIPNQNLFRIANENTTFSDAFAMADQVLYSGVACITDLMVKEGLINLDFADVRSIMANMGKAMMGTGEASGDGRAIQSAEAAIANPLLDETSMKGARGLLISITGGRDMTLFEVDEAATRIREEVDEDANIILGATFDEALEGTIRVSVVATGIEEAAMGELPASSTTRTAAIAKPVVTTVSPTISDELKPIAADTSDDLPAMATGDISIDARAAADIEKELEISTPSPASETAAVQPQMTSAASDIETELEAAIAANTMALDVAIQADQNTPEKELRVQRMPSLEELPQIAQDEIKAHSDGGHDLEESKPRGLLRRLTDNLGKKDEAIAPSAPLRPAQPATPAAAAPIQAQPPHARPQPGAGHFQPAQGNLDSQGRISPANKTVSEEDHMEIPAFLRRQSS